MPQCKKSSNIGQGVPAADWQAAFSEGQRLRARILFVDPASKRVGLSLLPRLLAAAPRLPDLPPLGTVYEASAPFSPQGLLKHDTPYCLWPLGTGVVAARGCCCRYWRRPTVGLVGPAIAVWRVWGAHASSARRACSSG